jgi:hypothetical protein
MVYFFSLQCSIMSGIKKGAIEIAPEIILKLEPPHRDSNCTNVII